ncbi:MAG: enolase C-terminal domain-like protein [Candidatus Limnocylindrales bacterium]|jgi:L-alanine-DL-glutamate epimerase-like enolase superfamily enzyme
MVLPDSSGLARLSRVEAIHVRVPFRRPLLNATGEFTHRRSWLLRLVDEDGNEGLGEAALNPIATDVTVGSIATLIRDIVPALAAGRVPAWAELAAEGEPGRAAMAGVDGAIGALLAARAANAAGVAQEALAGHAGGRAATYAPIPVSALIAFAGPDAGADAATQAVELGFETLKLRAGFERTTDQLVDRLRAIRAAIGPEPRLRIDAAGAWDLETAAERMEAVRPFRIEYVEQPLAAWDMTGHAALRERVRVSIALDESIDSEGSARAALAEGAADVIVVKPARVGGSAATMRVVEAASAAGASAVLGTYFETGVGIASVLRIAAAWRAAGRAIEDAGFEPAHGLATAGILVHDLLAVPLPIEKGRMAVPAAVQLDESEVERYTLERFEASR